MALGHYGKSPQGCFFGGFGQLRLRRWIRITGFAGQLVMLDYGTPEFSQATSGVALPVELVTPLLVM